MIQDWDSLDPFPHLVIDGFFEDSLARQLADEFPPFGCDLWHTYDNAVEVKKTLNNYNAFTPALYKFFTDINSSCTSILIGRSRGEDRSACGAITRVSRVNWSNQSRLSLTAL